ncbi:hypothetical protein GGX14DRAFT_415750, partial [Mycena pura]
MNVRRSWLLTVATVAPLQAKPTQNHLGFTSERRSALAEFSQVGPIVAGVLGGLSAILLLLLLYRIHRKYKIRRQRAQASGRLQDYTSGSRLLRVFRRERTPSSYWDDFLWEKDRFEEKDLEAFPSRKQVVLSQTATPASLADRPLPTVPAITRAPTFQAESTVNGTPLYPHNAQAHSSNPSGTSSLNVPNSSRAKLRLRPDPMLIKSMLTPSVEQLEEWRRQDRAGFTPAWRSHFDIPPPLPRRATAHHPVPPGLGSSHGRSQSDTAAAAVVVETPSVRGPRPRSQSNPHENEAPQRRTRHRSFSATVFSPIQSATVVSPTPAPQRLSRREIRASLRAAQEVVVALEEHLSISTIDIPPLTAHSRFFSPPNNNEHLYAEVEILRREVQRLQNLLLTTRRSGSETSFESDADHDPNPPPVY